MDLWLALAIVGLAATAALIQALAGFGSSLFIVPILALLIGPKDTVVLANLLSTFSNAMQATRLRHSADRSTATTLMIAGFLGMPLGLVVLLVLDPTALQVVIAVMVIVFTLLLMRGLALHSAGTVGDFIAGFTSGVLNTSTSMSGPPVVLYLQGKRMEPLQFRATISLFFLVESAVASVLLLLSGTFKPYIVVAWALAVPSVVIGQLAGNLLFSRIDLLVFRRIVYAILFLSAGVAIVGAVAG